MVILYLIIFSIAILNFMFRQVKLSVVSSDLNYFHMWFAMDMKLINRFQITGKDLGLKSNSRAD